MNKQVFVSHSADDRELAEGLVRVLEEFGIDCWIAPRDIPAGKDWDVSIIDAIENCSGTIFLISESSNASEQTKREVQIAVESDKWLIPICIDDVEPSKKFKYYLTSKQWFRLSLPPETDELRELLGEINQEMTQEIEPETRTLSAASQRLKRDLDRHSADESLFRDDAEDEQIRLVPKFADSGTESMFKFFTGEVDVAYMGLTPFVLGVAYGLPIRIVAIAQELHTSHGIVLKQDSILDRKENIKIGTVFGSSGHYLAHKWMQKEDLDISFVNLTTSEQKEAFEYGFLDGVAVWEPHLSLLEQMGGQCVYDTSELDTPIYNIIAASDSAIEEKGASLQRFLETHFSAIEHIGSNDSTEYEDYFQVIYNREISASKYGDITTNKYNWPRQNLLANADGRESIEQSLNDCFTFLNEFGLISNSGIDIDGCFPETGRGPVGRPTHANADRELKLGYSDSLLCATFHISQRLGLFEDSGIKIRSDERRLVEKVASFDKTYRNKISEIRDLSKNNFEAATVVLGKENNKLFNRIYERIFADDPPEEFRDVLDELDEENVLPGHVLTSAHWIRQLQKIAADDEGITSSQANDALTRFVDILEWFHNERDNLSQVNDKCPDCSYEIEDSGWKVCPQCGSQLSNICDNCGKELEPGWGHCPECGSTA
jgi:ABC-type nitrate/sulfonate/bicarbonate transport system substrate-binding protein